VLDALHGAFHDAERRSYRAVEAVVWGLIVLSVVLFGVELVVGSTPALVWADRLLLWVFAAEVSLRIGTFRPAGLGFYTLTPAGRVRVHVVGRLRYALRPLVLVDLFTVLALVPPLRGLRALRLLRLLRTGALFKYSNPFGGIARSFEDNRLLYAFAFGWLGVVVLLGGVSIWLVELDNPNAQIRTLGDGLWWAMVTLTTVGYGDLTPSDAVGRGIASVLMVGGMFTLALFAGVVGQTLLTAVLSIREEQFRMSGYLNHVVVCGFDEGSRMLVDALLKELDTDLHRIVLFAPGDRPSDLPVDVAWISGDPTKESELDKARFTHARAVLVVGSRGVEPQHADANSILTVFTLRRFLRAKAGPERQRPLHVVCEILESENVEHAKAAGADEVLETTRLGFSLLAHAVTEPGTASVLGRVAVPGVQNLYVGLPAGVSLPGAFSAVSAACLGSSGVLVIGVRRDGVDRVNPAHDSVVAPGDELIYIASARAS